MLCMEELFLQSKGRPVEYKGQIISMFDQISVSEQQKLRVCFESTNSTWRQGVHLSADGEFLVNDQVVCNAVVLWQDTAPREVELTVKTRKHIVEVKNVWDIGDGTMHSWHGGAGMIIEESESLRRYKCNDGRCDDNFDDFIFSVSLEKGRNAGSE